MKLLPLALISSAVLASSVAFAAPTTGAYLGAGIGFNTFNDDGLSGKIDKQDFPDGKFTATNFAGTVYGGYLFNRVFGLEASYNHYGKINGESGHNKAEFMDPTTLSLSANLGFSFANGIRPFALIGLSSLNANDKTDYFKDDKGASVHWGVGVDYTMPTMPLTVRAAYQADSFGIEDELGMYDRTLTVGMAYIGAAYRF